ncbi:hypothetical protein [Clostridium paraputrificum]|uniref:hypothetical protein n=1 Tax=Clostridium paraputrificum TaxID=29363 RepID=UPI00189ADA14|nr:hypothetical protein [Clostridium paraputrificum]
MEIIIDWVLRVSGVISLLCCIIAFFTPKREYKSDIKIKQINDILDMDKLGLHYYDIFEMSNEKYAELFAVMANGVDLKNISFYELEYNERCNKLLEKKKLREFKLLKVNNGILVKTIVPEGIPSLKVSWRSEYGLKGEYIFYYNGFNGNIDLNNYEYNYTFITKLRVFLGLK